MTNALSKKVLFAKKTVDDWARSEWIGEISKSQREELESLLAFWRDLMGLKLEARRVGRDPMGWLPFGHDPMLMRPLALCRTFLDELRASGIFVNRTEIERRIAALYARIEAECPLRPKPEVHLPPPRY